MIIRTEYLKSKFKIIEETIKKVENFKDKPDIAYMLSSYLVVFISGTYEECVEYLFIERSGKTNDEEIKGLVKNLIEQHFRNPTYDNIKGLLKKLSSKYVKILDKNVNKRCKDSLNSIVYNKNQIAHGGNCNVTISDITNYHKDAIKIFEELEKFLL